MKQSTEQLEVLAAIGRVTVEAGRLEVTLAELAEILVNPNELSMGKIFTTDMRVSRLVDSVIWLYSQRKMTDSNRLKGLLKRISALSKERNQVVHSRWIVSELSPGFPLLPIRSRTKKTRKGPVYDLKHLSKAEINDLADRIHAANTELIPFFREALRLAGFTNL